MKYCLLPYLCIDNFSATAQFNMNLVIIQQSVFQEQQELKHQTEAMYSGSGN